jgi:hypothetical protein
MKRGDEPCAGLCLTRMTVPGAHQLRSAEVFSRDKAFRHGTQADNVPAFR